MERMFYCGRRIREIRRDCGAVLRAKLRKAFNEPGLADMLLPPMKQRDVHTYPADKIKITGDLP